MNVFADPKRPLKPQQPDPPGTRIAGTILLVSLLLGAGLVAWRTVEDARAARVNTAAEARAMAAVIELQLQQAATAVEALVAAARQTGGSIPGFQTAAASLLSSRPGVASIELQPGGVVREVVPRAGNERAIGINVLNDPLQRGAVNAAIQRYAPVILGPAMLHNSEPGIVARAALFQKGRDGRESFRGLVAASVRLKDLATRAQLEGLWNRGYSYSLFVPGAPNRSAVGLLLRGEVSLSSAVQQPLKVHNLQLSLAVEPQGGWIHKTKLGLEVLLLLVVSGLIWVGARLLESKRAMSLELVELQQRAEHDARERARAEEENRAALQIATNREADLKKTQAALQQAESFRAESVTQFETRLRNAEQACETAQAKAQAAERTVSDLADQLAAANRAGQEAAKAHGAAQEQIQARLKKANEQVAEMQRRLDITGRGHEEALAASLQQAAADGKTISELTARLETVEKTSRHIEQAHTGRIADLERQNRELTAKLKKLEAAEKQVAELTVLLQESRAKTEAGKCVSSETIEEAANETPTELEAEVTGDTSPIPPASPVAPEGVDSPQLGEPAIEATIAESLPENSPASNEPPEEATMPTPSPAPSEPTAGTQPAKAGRRKKTRRDPQMDLFGSVAAENDDLDRPAVVAMDKDAAEAWPIEPESATSAVPERAREIELAAEEENAAAAEAKEVKDFPEVKGLSVSEGMAWADGNPKLFLKALREFAQQHAGTGDKIRAALEQGDAADAELLARGLKNSAGEIGAATLAESAIALARAIHDRAEPVDLEAAWTEAETQLHDLLIELKAVTKPKEEKPAPARRLPAPPPLDAAQLRKAMGLILPLLVDSDPGAKDCLKDNRNTFRSGFTAESYVDFEQAIKKGDFDVALEALKKAARKNGIPI